MGDLEIELKADAEKSRAGQLPTFTGVYTSRGPRPLALTFWWKRALRVVDAQGRVVAPGPGPVLPCGVAEEWEALEPGARWSYDLAPGSYHVTLVFEAPPPHGFTQSRPDPRAFKGRVESNEVTLEVTPGDEKPGFLSRLLGRS
jgi:hypothetical protein